MPQIKQTKTKAWTNKENRFTVSSGQSKYIINASITSVVNIKLNAYLYNILTLSGALENIINAMYTSLFHTAYL